MSCEKVNSSLGHLESKWVDPYLLIHGQSWAKIVIGIFIYIMLIVGSYLLIAAGIFEHNCGDPKKRGIRNQVNKIQEHVIFISIFNFQL